MSDERREQVAREIMSWDEPGPSNIAPSKRHFAYADRILALDTGEREPVAWRCEWRGVDRHGVKGPWKLDFITDDPVMSAQYGSEHGENRLVPLYAAPPPPESPEPAGVVEQAERQHGGFGMFLCLKPHGHEGGHDMSKGLSRVITRRADRRRTPPDSAVPAPEAPGDTGDRRLVHRRRPHTKERMAQIDALARRASATALCTPDGNAAWVEWMMPLIGNKVEGCTKEGALANADCECMAFIRGLLCKAIERGEFTLGAPEAPTGGAEIEALERLADAATKGKPMPTWESLLKDAALIRTRLRQPSEAPSESVTKHKGYTRDDKP
jgi:hypothetical protein